jgi:predicted nucleic acid-binding protein
MSKNGAVRIITKMRGELILLDTNILLTATDNSRPEFKEARELFGRALESGVHLCISSQIIREYLVAATRPVEVNGLGLSPSGAVHNIHTFKRRLIFLEETELVSSELVNLVLRHELRGKKIHDANIVAFMQVENIHKLISCNPEDFVPFSHIQVLSIESFLQG